jgi:P-type E1-E2 ATPase
VKECIQEFKRARIKVWMLTGDKGETAHNIGISCGLIDKNYAVLKIESISKDEMENDLKSIINKI